MRTETEMEAAVADMKREIAADVVKGIMPATVTDFSTLHDYVDANMYAGFCDDDRRADWDTEELATVQEKVDEWLAEGALAKVELLTTVHTITVTVEVHKEQDPRGLLNDLVSRYVTITEQEFMAGGDALMGYGPILAHKVRAQVQKP